MEINRFSQAGEQGESIILTPSQFSDVELSIVALIKKAKSATVQVGTLGDLTGIKEHGTAESLIITINKSQGAKHE